jgi:hypothetical protein
MNRVHLLIGHSRTSRIMMIKLESMVCATVEIRRRRKAESMRMQGSLARAMKTDASTIPARYAANRGSIGMNCVMSWIAYSLDSSIIFFISLEITGSAQFFFHEAHRKGQVLVFPLPDLPEPKGEVPFLKPGVLVHNSDRRDMAAGRSYEALCVRH